EDHGGHRHDRLGHRGDAEDRIGGHRHLGLAVAKAEGIEHHDLAVTRNQHHRTRQLAPLHTFVDAIAEPLQACPEEADLFWSLSFRYALRSNRQRDPERQCDQNHHANQCHSFPPETPANIKASIAARSQAKKSRSTNQKAPASATTTESACGSAAKRPGFASQTTMGMATTTKASWPSSTPTLKPT